MDSEADQNQDVSETSENKKFIDPNSFIGTLLVAVVLCLVCSLVVSTAAVTLRPIQQANQKKKQQRNVLIAAGIWEEDKHTDAKIPELFENIETIAVNLPGRGKDLPEAGAVNGDVDITSFNQLKASKDPEQSIVIGEADVAGIKRREMVSLVYLIHDKPLKGESDENESDEDNEDDEPAKLETIVLPIYGKGLWSTLYGYIALEADARTVKGITFYQHGETPGLGGEVDNPKWKAKWTGKIAIDESGEPIIEVTKPGAASENYQVDGLSGATITSAGIEKTIDYWLGDDAFGPFLDKYRDAETVSAE